MATRNPDCGIGVIVDDPHGEGAFAWECPCGVAQGGFPSKSTAKRAQREHRFPPAHMEAADEFVDRVAEAFDVPLDLLGDDRPVPATALPKPSPRDQKPSQIPDGRFQIVFTNADHAEADRLLRAKLAANPCLTGNHRPAYLSAGGIACGVCGARL